MGYSGGGASGQDQDQDQDKTGPRQGQTRPDEMRQVKTRQDKARRGKTRQDKTSQRQRQRQSFDLEKKDMLKCEYPALIFFFSDDDDDGEGEEPGLVLPCFGLVLSRRILVFAFWSLVYVFWKSKGKEKEKPEKFPNVKLCVWRLFPLSFSCLGVGLWSRLS